MTQIHRNGSICKGAVSMTEFSSPATEVCEYDQTWALNWPDPEYNVLVIEILIVRTFPLPPFLPYIAAWRCSFYYFPILLTINPIV